MKKFVFYLGFSLLLGGTKSYALDDPWYFYVNDIRECWKITKGQGVVVTLVDSSVNFTSILSGKEYILAGSQQQKNPKKSSSQKYTDHGTAMACIIAGDKGEFLVDGRYVTVAGIAPNSKILPVDMGGVTYLAAVSEGVKAAYNVRTTLSQKPAEVPDVYKRDVRLALINISSGDWYDKNRAYDWEAIKDKLNDDERILLIAGVGNDWTEACQRDKKCFLPGTYHPSVV